MLIWSNSDASSQNSFHASSRNYKCFLFTFHACFLPRFLDASSQDSLMLPPSYFPPMLPPTFVSPMLPPTFFSPMLPPTFFFSDASSLFFPMLPPKYFGRCFLPNRIMEIQIPRERSKILGLWSSIIAKRSTGNAWTKFWEPVQIFKRSRSSPSIVYRK